MTTKSKMPVQPLPGIGSLDEIARRYISQKQRDAMDDSDFAGPHQSFPIKTQEDVDSAAHLIGHADDPEAVKAKIIAIAKRKGLSVPDAWKEDMKPKNKAAARADQPDDAMALLDELTGNASPDDSEHEELTDDLDGVDGDNEDEPRADKATIERAMPAPDVTYYAPITRINKEKREVVGTATAEIKDAYRTVIGYEASKDAFQRWQGNIREMHQSKAVGRALEITPDDANRRIIVRARISKGAEDTWQKILDGTLTGFSIGGKNGKWTTRTIGGEELPYLERYDQAELSVVDNPACPTATFEVVRADGLASSILASESEMEATNQRNAQNPGGDDIERKSVRISAETRDALHAARDHAMNAAKQTMSTCGCDDCMSAMNKIAENDDNDGDMDAPDSMRKLVADIVRSELSAALTALQNQNAATMQRVNALLAADASRSEAPDITRRVDDMHEQLTTIQDLCERIAAQPTDGGPMLHGAPMDKRLATQNSGNASRSTDVDAIQRAMELGFAPPSDPNDAIRAAAKLIRPIPR